MIKGKTDGIITEEQSESADFTECEILSDANRDNRKTAVHVSKVNTPEKSSLFIGGVFFLLSSGIIVIFELP